MLKIKNRLNESKVSREELIKNCKICKTTANDLQEIVRIMSECFKIPSYYEAAYYLRNIGLDYRNSVKLVDKRTNMIYGLLLFGTNTIQKGTPIHFENPLLNNALSSLKQVNGIAFILDERLRGMHFDMKMLYYNIDYLKQYDVVWCGVDSSLKSHNYWKRLGFSEFLTTPNVQFYLKFI